MNENIIRQMQKSVQEKNVPEIKSTLVNVLLWNENKDTIDLLEDIAKSIEIFEKDNNQMPLQNENESLGEYIDRVSSTLMLNYSVEKYEMLRTLYKKYHLLNSKTNADINVNNTECKCEDKYDSLKNIFKDEDKKKKLIIVGLVAAGIIGYKIISRKKRNK